MTSASAEPAQQPDGLIKRVVGWLRAGYPDGVPQQDYVALLGILRRVLTPTEFEHVVEQLSQDAGDHSIITPAMVQARIRDVLKGPVLDEDVTRVSARLASAGWPLWSPDAPSAQGDMPRVRANLVSRIVEWLRKGYPTGLPTQDFVPLIALLRRRLTDAEVTEVGNELVEQGALPVDRIDVGTAIVKVTSEVPSDQDIERVRRYLADHGWPTDFSV